MSDKGIPEKFAKLMLDEPRIAEEVIKMGNIYYVYSWLDKNRGHLVCFPDGEMKWVTIPIFDTGVEKFARFLDLIRGEFPLISGAVSLAFDHFPNARLIYLDGNYKKLAERPFPLVRVTVFLKHLKGFIEKLIKSGLVVDSVKNEAKEFRTVITDSGQGGGMTIYSGVPERGFEWFCVDRGR